MRISKIQLKNGYKRFHNLTIDLSPDPKRIIALVGPNGCGKSSVLDGLLYLNNSYVRLGNKNIKDYNYHSMTQNLNYDYQNIEVDFIEKDYETIFNEKLQRGKENTIFSFRSPYRYNHHLKVTQSESISDIRLNNYGASTASDLDDKMIENYRRLYVKYNKYLNE